MSPSGIQAALLLEDNTGHHVELAHPAKRIVALYGGFTELLLALDAQHTLVARTLADDAPELASLPPVGTHMNPNIELIAALQPDLVLQLAGRKEAATQSDALRALGFTVLDFDISSFEQMFHAVQMLGRAVGKEEKAMQLLKAWKQRLAQVAQRYRHAPPVHVFYEVRYPNLLAAGQNSIVNDIITCAGGINIVSQGQKLVRFSEETLLMANPECYLMQQGHMNPSPQPLETRRHYVQLKAVQEQRVLVVQEDMFARPGPQVIDAVELLANWLHASAAGKK